jgi:hypothetical protein
MAVFGPIAAVWLVAVLVGGLAPPAQAFGVYEESIQPYQLTFSPGAGAASGSHAVLWSTGAASAYLSTTAFLRSMQFVVDTQQCEGAPHLQVAVDGVTRFSQEVDGRGYYGLQVDWPPGRHKVTFRFLDDHRTSSCDRNILLGAVWFYGLSEDGSSQPIFTSTWLKDQYVAVEPTGAGSTNRDQATLRSNGSLRFRLDSQISDTLYVGLLGKGYAGRRGDVLLTMDGEVLYRGPAPDGYAPVTVDRFFVDGPHVFVLTMTHDSNTATCDGTVGVNDVVFDGQRQL